MKYQFTMKSPEEFQRLMKSLEGHHIKYQATIGSEKAFGKRSYEQERYYILSFETDDLPVEFEGLI